MSSELKKKKDQLVALLDEATNPKNAKKVTEAFDKINKVELKFRRVILRLKAIERYWKKNNRKKAIFAYNTFFFNMVSTEFGQQKDAKVKGKYSIDKIEAFIDNKYSQKGLRGILRKVEQAHRIFRSALKPVAKVMKAYNLICNTKELLKKSSEVYDLFQAQKSLKTAESYKQYYEDAGKLFSNAVSVMGVVTSILPRGASDYCDFIFTAAKNSLEAVDIVSKHTEKILKLCKEIDKLSDNFGKKDFTSGRDALKFDDLDKYYKYRGK